MTSFSLISGFFNLLFDILKTKAGSCRLLRLPRLRDVGERAPSLVNHCAFWVRSRDAIHPKGYARDLRYMHINARNPSDTNDYEAKDMRAIGNWVLLFYSTG
jgi:hypothetical protein